MEKIKKIKQLNTLKSYLLIYPNITFEKLSNLCNCDQNKLFSLLEELKNFGKQIVWTSGPVIQGIHSYIYIKGNLLEW